MTNDKELPWTRTVSGKDGDEFVVKTYELSMAHGPDRNQWYETTILEGPGYGVHDRYETEEAAKKGHDRTCDALYNGEYSLRPVSYMLELEEEQ